jgi:hypothetical protein
VYPPGFHGRPRTGRAGGLFRLDAPPSRACSPCVRPAAPVFSRSAGGREGGALMTGVPVRETVTLCGRAEGVRLAERSSAGLVSPGQPCGDAAVLLELFGVTWFELSQWLTSPPAMYLACTSQAREHRCLPEVRRRSSGWLPGQVHEGSIGGQSATTAGACCQVVSRVAYRRAISRVPAAVLGGLGGETAAQPGRRAGSRAWPARAVLAQAQR